MGYNMEPGLLTFAAGGVRGQKRRRCKNGEQPEPRDLPIEFLASTKGRCDHHKVVFLSLNLGSLLT